jgi:HD-like signal output (HDOD) protein
MEIEVPASVTRLLAAIHKGGEFPAMAQTVDVINSMTSSESTSSEALSEIILQDFGLTQKLLRLVNTLAYSQYGEVTTITRAVLLMGFDRVRSMATSLILFEHFRKQARSTHLVDVLNKAFYSAVIGRTIAHDTGFADGEEAFISTLYHRLGRILVAFYMPDEYGAIEAAPDGERERTTIHVLGLSFEGMGLAIADALHMPERLRESMTSVASSDINRIMNPSERLSCLATLSNAMVDVLTTAGDADTRRDAVERLVTSYAKQIKIADKVDTLIARTVAEVKGSASAFKLKLAGTPLAASLAQWGLSEKGVGRGALESESGALVGGRARQDAAPQSDSPETVLTKGVHEVTALLISDNSLDDILRVVLETIYRALGVGRTKVLFLLKDPGAPIARLRFGFGQAADETALWSEVKIAGNEDVISQCINRGRDLVIRSARGPGIAQAIPPWLVRLGVLDRFVVLLPLMVGNRPVGMFYIDGDKQHASILTPAFVNQLKVLRDHIVLAIQQRAGRKA